MDLDAAPDPLLDRRTPVTLVCGMSAAARGAVVMTALRSSQRVVVVEHGLSDLREHGRIHRHVYDASGVVEDEVVDLDHGCISCTLREDVLPALLRLAREERWHRIVLSLPDVVEPDGVVAAIEDCIVHGVDLLDVLRVEGVVVAVDTTTLVPELRTTDDLRDRGIQAADEDRRTVAEVVARQIEGAEVAVLVEGMGDEPMAQAQAAVLVEHLNPTLEQLRGSELTPEQVVGVVRHDPDAYRQRFEPGVLAPSSCTCACGISSLVFRARRPFHPERLHDALGELAAEPLRGRGHIWLATRPRTLLEWETAGGSLALTPVGRWLAGAPDDLWSMVTPLRRTLASMAWDPYYGDREQALVLTGIDLDHAELIQLLDSCLLTDEELAGGEEGWRALDDPFVAYLTDEDVFLEAWQSSLS